MKSAVMNVGVGNANNGNNVGNANNVNFKEAILFLAELSGPKNAKRWKEVAESATNEDVLFIRT
jgi:ABC-type glycerol-3-phosphate transport system substrate-binding protein